LFLLAACGRLHFDATADGSGSATYVQTVLADGPVGYWRLGEKAGTIAFDSSGHGLDGTYQGGLLLGQAGAIAGDPDSAVLLDGSTGLVRIPNSPGINAISNSVVTVEAWVSGGLTETAELFSTWDGTTNGFQVVWDSGDAGSFAANQGVRSPRPITDNNWHQVVIVWNGGTTTVYVDAQLAASGSSPFTPSAFENQIGTQCFSALSTGCSLFHGGGIDEVSVYDAALDSARIQAHYAAARPL
jgi:hypothetical protein